MRSFELVGTSRKKMYKKRQAVAAMIDQLLGRDGTGKAPFLPSVIFPIAHGGSDIGLTISNAYDSLGHEHIVYPLMFSIKQILLY